MSYIYLPTFSGTEIRGTRLRRWLVCVTTDRRGGLWLKPGVERILQRPGNRVLAPASCEIPREKFFYGNGRRFSRFSGLGAVEARSRPVPARSCAVSMWF